MHTMIEFPNLGIYLENVGKAVTVFNFDIAYYGITIGIGMLMGILIASWQAKRVGVNPEHIVDLAMYGIIFGIIGARIYYVLFNLDYYLQTPSEIIMIWNGGLAIHGGIIATLLFTIWYSKKNKINLLLMLDIIVVGLIIAQAIGRWGNFFNGEAYGRVISLHNLQSLHIPNFIIKGMYIDGNYHEPTFLYESILSLIGFIVLLIIRKTKKNKTGQLLGLYLIWYGTERLIIESMRTDSLMLGPIRVAQLVSCIGIVCGIYFILKNIKKDKYYHSDKIILN